jgi:hypothetical protein
MREIEIKYFLNKKLKLLIILSSLVAKSTKFWRIHLFIILFAATNVAFIIITPPTTKKKFIRPLWGIF